MKNINMTAAVIFGLGFTLTLGALKVSAQDASYSQNQNTQANMNNQTNNTLGNQIGNTIFDSPNTMNNTMSNTGR